MSFSGAQFPTSGSIDAFFESCLQGNLSLVKHYLDAGMPVGARESNKGHTALHVAASVPNNKATVALLIERGADVHAEDARKQTPLHFAADVDIAKALVVLSGPQTVGEIEHSLLPLPPHLSQRVTFDVNKVNDVGETPLFNAVRSNCLPLVSFLLELRALVNKRNSSEYTCLALACEQGNHEIASALLDEMADHKRPGNGGWCPIHHAVQGGHTKVCQLLLDKGADANAKTPDGIAPLHLAVSTSNPGLVSVLLNEKGIQVNARTSDGETPLDWAVRFDNRPLADMLRHSHMYVRVSDDEESSDVEDDQTSNSTNSRTQLGSNDGPESMDADTSNPSSRGAALTGKRMSRRRAARSGDTVTMPDIPVGALRRRRTSMAYIAMAGHVRNRTSGSVDVLDAPDSPVRRLRRSSSVKRKARDDHDDNDDCESVDSTGVSSGPAGPDGLPIYTRRRRKTTTSSTLRGGDPPSPSVYPSLQQRRNSAVMFPLMPEEFASRELSRSLAAPTAGPMTPASGSLFGGSAPEAPRSWDAATSGQSTATVPGSEGGDNAGGEFVAKDSGVFAPTFVWSAPASHSYSAMQVASSYTNNSEEQFVDDK